MAHYLVTGGAGFIGSHLSTESSVRRGHRVRVADTLITGKRSNLDHIPRSSSWKAISPTPTLRARGGGGLRLRAAPGGDSSVPRSVKDPITSNRANVDATLNMLVAARDAGVKRLVFAASSSAYGNTPTLPKREDMPTGPLSPYALQKVVGEQYLQMFTRALRPRDGEHPLLQRLRSAAGSVIAVLGRDLGVRHARCSRTGRRTSMATASRRAISPTSPTSSTACCERARRRSERRESSTSRPAGGFRSTRSSDRCATSSVATSNRPTSPVARATCATPRPTSQGEGAARIRAGRVVRRGPRAHDRVVPNRSRGRNGIDGDEPSL